MVEVTGLEPAASWSQTKHSTKLSYASTLQTQRCYYIIKTAFVNINTAKSASFISIDIMLKYSE